MSNQYFQLKQFRVEQGRCSMKVSTDACIQGAWTPVPASVKTILDIGTGTGLLSLMLAQRLAGARIDAVELDPDAASQASENFRNSPWSGRLSVTAVDVRQLFFQDKYDLVICNPPFFTNSLLGPDRGRNLARHGLSLSLPELLQTLELSLEPEGIASLLLPPVEHQRWAELLDSEGWHIVSQLQIVPVSGRLPNRIISICSRSGNELQAEEQLVIREETGRYTEAFTSLMAPFYLNL